MSAWIDQIFTADQAASGGVVRRSRADVDRYGGGIANVVTEAKLRGWHVVETGDQVVILCHSGALHIHC